MAIYRNMIRTYHPEHNPWALRNSYESWYDKAWHIGQIVCYDAVSGITLICIIGVSFLVMVRLACRFLFKTNTCYIQISFADFLRLNWNVDAANGMRNRRRRRRGGLGRPPRIGAAAPRVNARMREDIIARQPAPAVAEGAPVDPVAVNPDAEVAAQIDIPVDEVPAVRLEDDVPVALEPAMGDGGPDEPELVNFPGGAQAEFAAEVIPANDPPIGTPDINANVFFDDDGLLQDENIDAAVDAAEIRIAVNDILGLQGPIIVLVRNTIMLVSFDAVYIWFFGYGPYRMGIMAFELIRNHSRIPFSSLATYIPESISKFYAELMAASATTKSLIVAPDVGIMLSGYIFICVIVFSFGNMANFIQKRILAMPTAFRAVKVALHAISIVASILKVGTLLFLRIFWLPLVIGCMALYCANALFEYSQEDIINFSVENMVGFSSVAWVLGITFMLIVTLSVLQLREVLHPDILARKIRPQVKTKACKVDTERLILLFWL
jgi:hypothetical protein